MALSLKNESTGNRHNSDKTGQDCIIGKHDIKISDGKYTPEILWSLGRILEKSCSCTGKVAYTIAYYCISENKEHTVMHIMDQDGKNDILLTKSGFNESSPRWIKGCKKIAFLCNESGSSQIWEMNPDGTERKQISFFEKDIDSFKVAPDNSKILFISQAPYIYKPEHLYKDLDKTTGLMANDLMYKHWDKWLKTVPHPFFAPFDGNKMGEAKDILEGTRFESPLLPFGGIEQLTWSNDSKTIAYTCKKKAGKAYTLSTDSDIYLYDTEAGKEVNICKLPGDPDQNMGYDMNPAYSPCGRYLAWLSMERDGYESDKNRLYVMDLETKKKTYLTKDFDNDVMEFCWDTKTASIFFLAVWHGRTMVYRITLEGEVTQITEGDYDFEGVSMMGDKIIIKRHSLVESDDLYSIDPANDNGILRLTHENDHILGQLKFGKVEERWTKTVDGKELMSWVMYPADFDPSKKYPGILMCMGGPQVACSQLWLYRWNYALLVEQGQYIMILPNRRGCPGFGEEWKMEISKDYGGLCMHDYFSAIDDLATEPYIDKDRLGCIGASFGGYSTYWMAGHHEKRFKVFAAHDGIFNQQAMYTETDEMWFLNWDLGGAYWEKDNEVAQRSYSNSPHLFIEKWDTPILCIHNDLDYRILVSQGQSAFDAAKLRGLEAEHLCFTDECHWVNKPQNSILWYRVMIDWLNRHLK